VGRAGTLTRACRTWRTPRAPRSSARWSAARRWRSRCATRTPSRSKTCRCAPPPASDQTGKWRRHTAGVWLRARSVHGLSKSHAAFHGHSAAQMPALCRLHTGTCRHAPTVAGMAAQAPRACGWLHHANARVKVYARTPPARLHPHSRASVTQRLMHSRTLWPCRLCMWHCLTPLHV